MAMTHKNALERHGSRYRLRKTLSEGRVIRRSRGLYAQADDPESPLVDMPPETIDAAMS